MSYRGEGGHGLSPQKRSRVPSLDQGAPRHSVAAVTATDWGVLLAGATLIVTIPTLLLMVLQEIRARERADVEWQVECTRQGNFRVTNVGADAARKVTVEMWSRSEIEKTRAKRLNARDHLDLVLPGRVAHGPDPVEGLPEPYPRPSGVPVPQFALDHLERLRHEAEGEQVSVKVVWRTRWGTWKTYVTRTG